MFEDDKIEAEMRRLKRINYTVFAIVVLIIAALLVGIVIHKVESEFMVSKWMNAPEFRVKIVDDMLEENPLLGMSRFRVEALLGDAGEEDTVYYYLGPERGLISIDSEWLVIEYSEDTVMNYYITTD